MKNRDYKDFAPDNYYHIFNRGNAKMKIFLDDEDYSFFLLRLEENIFPERFKNKIKKKQDESVSNYGLKGKYTHKFLPDGSFDLVCYCLMPNHFHLLIKQNSEIKISELMLRVCGSYAKYFNKKYNRVGSIFQDQFKAVWVNRNNYLLWLSAYIHKNPEGKLTQFPEDWPWSSYREYLGMESKNLCFREKGIVLEQIKSNDYKNFVGRDFEKDESAKLSIFLLDLEGESS